MRVTCDFELRYIRDAGSRNSLAVQVGKYSTYLSNTSTYPTHDSIHFDKRLKLQRIRVGLSVSSVHELQWYDRGANRIGCRIKYFVQSFVSIISI